METVKKFLDQSFDKFTEKTTTSLTLMGIENPKIDQIPMILRGKMYNLNIKVNEKRFMERLQIDIRHVKSPNVDNLLFDYKYEGEEWLHVKNMIININGVENITLEANETNTSTDSAYSYYVNVVEEGYFIISKEILKKICDANELDVVVNGSSYRIQLENKNKENKNGIDKLRFLCRVFNSEFYADSTHDDWINTVAAQSKSACFIATATMGNYNHPVVMDLRKFRDNWLLKRQWGIYFTNWYYKHGPKAARIIERSFILRKLTFVLIVKPLQIMTKKLK